MQWFPPAVWDHMCLPDWCKCKAQPDFTEVIRCNALSNGGSGQLTLKDDSLQLAAFMLSEL